MGPRPTPYALALAGLAEERFPAIRAELDAAGHDPRDRDAFLLGRAAAALVHELRPEDGLGEGVAELAALVHHAYLCWDAGLIGAEVTANRLGELVSEAPGDTPEPGPPRYVAVPPRTFWGSVVEGAAAEPLDGCFLFQGPTGDLHVLGVFGFHPDRAGFSVVEVAGPPPGQLLRPDGSPPYSATLPGAGPGLHSLAGGEELLALGWRLASHR